MTSHPLRCWMCDLFSSVAHSPLVFLMIVFCTGIASKICFFRTSSYDGGGGRMIDGGPIHRAISSSSSSGFPFLAESVTIICVAGGSPRASRLMMLIASVGILSEIWIFG